MRGLEVKDLGILGGKRNKEIGKVVLLPVEKIAPNPSQPRKHFDEDSLQELCRSIITNGLLQPVTVRKLEGDTYELVAGERRTMAFRSLGRDFIPGIVEECTEAQSAVMSLVENMQRKNLNYFEEAAGIARLMSEQNLTQAQVSARLGKAQSTVANKLRLLKYPQKTQEKLLHAGLTERHARTLLRIEDPEVLDAAVEHIVGNGFNVEQTESYVEHLLDKHKHALKTKIFVVKDMRIFMNTVGKAVDLMRASGIPVDMDKRENDCHVEFILKIPKSAVYNPAGEQKAPQGPMAASYE